MRLGTSIARLAVIGVLAMSLSGCGHSSSKQSTLQKPISGCDVPNDWSSKRLVQEEIVDGFRAEHAVKDPVDLKNLNDLYAKGRAGTSLNFDAWYGGNEDRPSIALRGATMFKWELFIELTEFPKQSDVYPGLCAGWTFEGYLQKHPDIDKAYIEAQLSAHRPTSFS